MSDCIVSIKFVKGLCSWGGAKDNFKHNKKNCKEKHFDADVCVW